MASLRFLFRQIDYRDLERFLADGEIRSKNHVDSQPCHQTSYSDIVNRRGSGIYELPGGGVVNDFVAFYLSPVTAFTYTIHRGNVDVLDPDGQLLAKSNHEERIFFVFRANDVVASGVRYCFSDLALNSNAPMPNVSAEILDLERHIDWSLFDEPPLTAAIPEIGYSGVCKYFVNKDTPLRYQNRKQKRMAEFLVYGSVSINLAACLVVPTVNIKRHAEACLNIHGLAIPVYLRPDCFIL